MGEREIADRNFLDEFLKKEVPDWEDDDFARARFKAFTGQKQDWEDRMNFWKDLIVKIARRLDILVIDTHSIEMKKSGELDTMEQVLGARPSTYQLVGTLLRKAIIWAGLNILSDNYAETKPVIEERLVVMSVLQERVLQFLKTLADSHHSSTYIATLAKIKELCGGSEDAELVVGCLLLQNKALFMSLAGRDHIEGFKISLNENPVASVSESDHHMLQLQWTMEMLQHRLNTLDERIAMARNAVIKSMKAGDKRVALRYVRSMKLLQRSQEQCAGYMDKIDQVLGIAADAETSKKVSEAMQVASVAIKENHVSMDEVQHTLSELDEAIALQRETEEALAGAPLSISEVGDDAVLDEELALLEYELEAESLSLPDVPKVPVMVHESESASPSQGPDSHPQNAQEELQKQFAKLGLELG